MNRGHWKQYSTWQPEQKSNCKREMAEDSGGFSGEVQVKKGYSWSEQIGVAVAALVEFWSVGTGGVGKRRKQTQSCHAGDTRLMDL